MFNPFRSWGWFLVIAFLCARLYAVLPARLRRVGSLRAKKKKVLGHTVKTLVVLGKGGHTSEMLAMLTNFPEDVFTPLLFVASKTDHFSESRLRKWEDEQHIGSDGINDTAVARHRVFYIARAREVGQSWWSTVFTLVLSFLDSLLLVFRELPELVLCDGPGTCLPVCCAAFVLRFCGLKNTKIVFVESFARVKTLSLTGKCLLFVVDRFVVQWKELLDVGFLGRPLGDGWGAEHIGYLL